MKQKAKKVPSCFVSYAWGNTEHERWVEYSLAKDLQKAGLDVILDRWENPIGANLTRFVERIDSCDAIIVVGTPLYQEKYNKKSQHRGNVVAAEGDIIARRLVLGTDSEKESVFPIVLEGKPETSLPTLLRTRVFADFTANAYFNPIFDLILSVYQIPVTESGVADLRSEVPN